MRTSNKMHVGNTESRLSKLIAGLDELPPSTRLSDQRTAAELRQEALERLSRYDGVHRAKLVYEERMQERDQHEVGARAFLDDAADLLVAKFGRRSRQLLRFGVKPRREPAALTGAEIVAKTEKARLTRENRESRCPENECRRTAGMRQNSESPARVAASGNGTAHD